MWIQELFTELKKLAELPRYELTNSGRISRNFGTPKRAQNRRISKIQETSSLCIPVYASVLPKMKKYGQNGDEFYCLEAKFLTPKIPGFLIHFAKFREICPSSSVHISAARRAFSVP